MKVFSIIKYTFTSIGLAMLVATFFLYQSTQSFLSTAQTTNGIVIDVVSSRSNDTITYAPVISFIAPDGREVIFTSSGSKPAAYTVSDSVEVLYQPSNPNDVRINTMSDLWGPTMLMSILGSVFFLIGFIIILVGRAKNKRIKHLKSNGTPVEAKFQSVELNVALKVNGKSPYQIITQWTNPQTSKLHIFKSENIWFDPSSHIKDENITVLIERNNPKTYYVDTSFLPDVAA